MTCQEVGSPNKSFVIDRESSINDRMEDRFPPENGTTWKPKGRNYHRDDCRWGLDVGLALVVVQRASYEPCSC